MTDLRPRILEFLRGHDTMTLATLGPDGTPQAAAVFYAADDEFNLYFLSDPSTRHGRDLKLHPRVAATVQADGQPWATIRGLQIEGTARRTDDAGETARAARVYGLRFAFVRELLDGIGAPRGSGAAGTLEGGLARGRFHVLRPDWIRLIDNTKGFGHKEELSLSLSGSEAESQN
jgi:uncharacterized protein YhbP (UPF0306 family)